MVIAFPGLIPTPDRSQTRILCLVRRCCMALGNRKERGRPKTLCLSAPVWLVGPGLSLWNALDLKLTLPVPVKCGMLNGCLLWG